MSWYTDAVCVCETDLKSCESEGLTIWECDSDAHNCQSEVVCNGTVNYDCQTLTVERDIWFVLLFAPEKKYLKTLFDWKEDFSTHFSIPAVEDRVTNQFLSYYDVLEHFRKNINSRCKFFFDLLEFGQKYFGKLMIFSPFLLLICC